MRSFALLVLLTVISSQLASAQQYPDSFTKISRSTGGMTTPINNNARFGVMSGNIGDLDDDGVPDIAVGASNQNGDLVGGVTILYLKADGTVKNNVSINNSEGFELDSFGSSVTGLGDLNDDGIEDIGVGAAYDSDTGSRAGAFWILFMNKNGSVKSRRKITGGSNGFTATITDDSSFGSGASSIGDLDGDGNAEVAMGARFTDTAYILFFNNDGTVKKYTTISAADGLQISSGGLFGYGMAGIGDVNGDGIKDVAIGGHRSAISSGDSGAVYVVFLKADGTVKGNTLICANRGNFTDATARLMGLCIAGIGDYNSDGTPDIIVGGDDTGSNTGAVWYIMLKPDGTVKSYHKISSTTADTNLPLDTGDFFGSSVCYLNTDINGDGIKDVAIGAFQDDDGGGESGAMWISVPCTVPLANAGDDINNYCGLKTAGLHATFTGSFGTWSVSSGTGIFSDIHDENAIVSNLAPGKNEFTWTVFSYSCGEVKDNVVVNVNSGTGTGITTSAGPDVTVCSTKPVMMRATLAQGHTGKWSIISGSAGFTSLTDPNATLLNMREGKNEFMWTESANGCGSGSDNVVVFVDPVVAPDAGDDQVICEDTKMITLTGNQPYNMNAVWSIKGTAAIAYNASPTTTVTGLRKGINAFVWTFSNESYCPTMSDTALVVVLGKPSANIAMPDTTRTCMSEIQITADSTQINGVGTWKVIAGSGTIAEPGKPGTTVTVNDPNTPIQIQWNVSNNACPSDSDVRTIMPFRISGDDVPNVITPNNDGKNDQWKIKYLNLTHNQLRLYDSWGKQVFETDDYKGDWRGGDLPAGVYYYYINLSECKTNVKGWLDIRY